ncbi:MAG: hypothetical protein IKP58_11200 [Victivallales bacterium]|nr:hypothetical protein [Victivallales bacterium]
MKIRTERLENGNLRVHLPVALRCRGGHRIIVPLDGDEPAQEASLATMLARAWSWQRAIDEGRYPNGKELAAALGIDRSFVSRTLRLAMLSPEIVHRIVTDDIPPTLTAMRLRESIPLDWGEQERELLGE